MVCSGKIIDDGGLGNAVLSADHDRIDVPFAEDLGGEFGAYVKSVGKLLKPFEGNLT